MVLRIRILLIILGIISQQMIAFSQETTDSEKKLPLSSKLYMSYVFGAQLYNDNALYNPGLSVLFTESYRVSSNIDIGIGSGYTSLTGERFIPIFIEAFGNKNSISNSPIIKFQFGYSAAWYKQYDYPSDYNLNGGVYFSAGMGRRFWLRNRYSILFHWSYCHQSANVEYQVFGGHNYSNMVYYDMIKISMGVIWDSY